MLFSRSAAAEARCKNLQGSKGQKRGIAFTSQLILSAQDRCRQTGLPFFHIDESRQQGEGFGERLFRAMRAVFELGFENLIVVGNDCPDLSAADLLRAASRLQRQRCVIGPDARGGLYLLGLHRSLFTKTLFDAVTWQRGDTCLQLQAQLLSAGFGLLPVLQDLNDAQELRHWVTRSLSTHRLARLLFSWISSLVPLVSGAASPLNGVTGLRLFGLRAPPVG